MSAARLATDLGDLAVAAPAGLVISLWCARKLDRTLAVSYALAFISAVVLTAALKVLSRDFSAPLELTDPFAISEGAPSGHAVLATLVYGVAAWLFALRVEGCARWPGVIASVGALAAVLATRVTLHAHTIADVLAGVALATPFLLVATRIAKVRAPGVRASGWSLLGLIALTCTFALFSGLRLSSTRFI